MNQSSSDAASAVRSGIVLILSGPSGSGKSTIYRKAIPELGNIEFSVSCTTRAPRPGETDGKDYYFISKERFLQLKSEQAFVESADVHGNCYGTLKSELLTRISRGIDVLLDIDVQGADQIRSQCALSPELRKACKFIFIAPPSMEELERRLRSRGTETEDVILRRLANAAGEMVRKDDYDFSIVNNDLECAVSEFISLVRTLRECV